MNTQYPDHKTYEQLYLRFFKDRGPQQLIELAGDVRGKRVLDLCGGNGRLSVALVECGADSVVLVDQQKAMIPTVVLGIPGLSLRVESIERWLARFIPENNMLFQAAFCQQAVNYWLNEHTAVHLARILEQSGVFVFNTFNRKPPASPMVKQYELEGHAFVEVSWLVKDLVHHVQIRSGLEPHYTVFRWLSPEYLQQILEPYFSVSVIVDGTTSLYRCVRK